MDQQEYLDFRELLVVLEPWDQARRRRTLVRAALWKHRVLSQVNLDGAAMDSASELLQACSDFDEPTQKGLTSQLHKLWVRWWFGPMKSGILRRKGLVA